jgi:hypothetical protein
LLSQHSPVSMGRFQYKVTMDSKGVQ